MVYKVYYINYTERGLEFPIKLNVHGNILESTIFYCGLGFYTPESYYLEVLNIRNFNFSGFRSRYFMVRGVEFGNFTV